MVKTRRIPAFIVAGASSGSGKTIVTLGILEALRKRGLIVQAFKAGPDYIDPGLHRMVLGRPSYNLDTWMMGARGVRDTFLRAIEGADCAVIEGVMGLYDGKDGSGEEGSTAHLSKVLGVPVLLVANAEKAARSMGALVKGFEAYDPEADIRWALFNRVGSDRHSRILADSISRDSRIKLIGCIRRDEALKMEERHLGLVTAAEASENIAMAARSAARAVEAAVDLDALLGGALVEVPEKKKKRAKAKGRVRVAVAFDRAFSFYYQENLDLLEGLGAELLFFSPLKDPFPEGASGLYIGGGYPELYSAGLEANTGLRRSIKRLAYKGMPVYAECGGLMYLGGTIEHEGEKRRMAGVFPWATRLVKGRKALGYREVVFNRWCPFLKKGRIRGHEFHYSEIVADPAGLRKAYRVAGGAPDFSEGFTRLNALASYVHLHFGSNPGFAEGFIKAAQIFSSREKR
ncbi:MAG TPA: cobyrinic acid a,c-diamide synthase [Deltaproteobacteria bacterium]|nr:cobyrinic acid a,c-diamide synthase [Deltaproteobacteria bacterium]HCY10874.1 cobyrinic acid a,c-diamide synthase [Deltaproteobacteria bacterium]